MKPTSSFDSDLCSRDQLWPILNTLVPHTGQVPRVAGLPFFKVTLEGSFMSRFALHLKQYACTELTPFQTV